MLIKQTTKLQYEYEGRVYDSFEELKKKETEHINCILRSFVEEEVNEMMRDFHKHYDRSSSKLYCYQTILSTKSDEMVHIVRLMDIKTQVLKNALREFAWRQSYA